MLLRRIIHIENQTLFSTDQMEGKHSSLQQENSDEIQSEHKSPALFKQLQIL